MVPHIVHASERDLYWFEEFGAYILDNEGKTLQI
jgi:hypothetical protein